MKARFGSPLLVLIVVLSLVAPVWQVPLAAQGASSSAQASGLIATGQSSLLFIENVGQFAKGARYQVFGADATMWLADDALWITVVEQPEKAKTTPSAASKTRGMALTADRQALDAQPPRAANVKITFPGANAKPRLEAFDRLSTHVSYFIGKDASTWRPDVPVWGGVRYKDLYPGIDLELTGDGSRLTPLLVAQPGADLRQVRLRVEGADKITVDSGAVRLTTGAGRFSLPLLHVETPSGARMAGRAGQPQLDANIVSNPFVAATPASAPLAPTRTQLADANSTLAYSVLLGGSGFDHASALAVAPSGNLFVAGITVSADFPTTPGAYDEEFNDDDPLCYQYFGRPCQWEHTFVAQLDPTGTSLIYATFLAGSRQDSARSIVVDAVGNAYIAGVTVSPDFPTTEGALDRDCGSDGTCDNTWENPRSWYPVRGLYDAYLVELDASGTALLYSTYLGGRDDDLANNLARDSQGNLYIVGYTASVDFPTVNARQAEMHNTCFYNPGSLCHDIFLTKIAAGGGSLLFSTYLGGADDDYAEDLVVDAFGATYITGYTASPDFPVMNALQLAKLGPPDRWSPDALVAKFASDGALVYSTFLGGTDQDSGSRIALDTQGAAYVYGWTGSHDFPTLQAYDPTCGSDGTCNYTGQNATDNADLFLAKVSPQGNSLLYSTFIGGSRWENPGGIAVDALGNVFLVGGTNSSNFPTTPDAIDPTCGSDGLCNAALDPYAFDAFVLWFKSAGAGGPTLQYGTFLGGAGLDGATAMALGTPGKVYVAIMTMSADFPTPATTFGTDLSGSGAIVITKLLLGEEQSTASAVVVPNSPAAITLPNNDGGISFPAGLVINPTTFVYTQLPAPTQAASTFTFAGNAFTLVATDSNNQSVTHFANSYTITLTYQDSDWQAAGISNESLLNLYYWDTAANGWVPVLPCTGCALYPVTNTLVAVLDHLTEFAIMAPKAPQVRPITAPVDPVAVVTAVNASAAFLDANTADTHTAIWNWGDGSVTQGTVTPANGSGTASGSHTYTAAGVYTVKLTVTDSSGLTGQAEFRYVVVYDASGGFVTGGGWINSPAGAYAADPTLVGKANFGFVSKYQKGATIPTGNTEFQFKVANLNFKSTAYDWLVVAGARAQYKGVGTINGSGSYNFMLTAIDGQASGGGGVDKFRIKIWSGGGMVYDNQVGGDKSDTADPTTVIGGGSIVIHKD